MFSILGCIQKYKYGRNCIEEEFIGFLFARLQCRLFVQKIKTTKSTGYITMPQCQTSRIRV